MPTFQIGDCPTTLVTTEAAAGPRRLRQGRIELTVRNTAAADRTGRITVLSERAEPAWFAIEGAAPTSPGFLERDFAAGAAQKVTVLVSIPPEAAPGDYVFQVQVANEDDPNNDFVNGPSVALTVPPLTQQQPARPFPWWTLAVAAVIILIIGGGVAFYLRPEPAPPPPPPPLEAQWDGVDSAPQTELVPGQALRPIKLAAVGKRGDTPVEIQATYTIADTCPWVTLTAANINGSVPYWLPELQKPCETVARGSVTDAAGDTATLPDLPLRFVPKARNIADLTVGSSFGCALSANNSVACWGAGPDEASQYGGGVAPPNLKAKLISSGYYSACALKISGGVVCWGNFQGQEGTVPDDIASDPDHRVTGLVGGARIACAMFENSGTAYSCWGAEGGSAGGGGASDPLLLWQPFRSRDGRTRCALDGYGSLNCSLVDGGSVKVIDGPTSPKVVDFTEPDNSRVCALLANNTVRCQVFGNAQTVDLAGMPADLQQIVDTGLYICVLARSGEVSCLLPPELPTTVDATTFHPAIPDGLKAVKLVGGDFYAVCAITAEDKVACWGAIDGMPENPVITRIPTSLTF